LQKNPGFTGVAVVTLALGMGANAAIFGLVDSAFLRGLPFREPDRLVHIWTIEDLKIGVTLGLLAQTQKVRFSFEQVRFRLVLLSGNGLNQPAGYVSRG
jgi:hypothetical protein